METRAMEELYQKIANKINEMIPETWTKTFIYAQVDEGMTEVYFYFYPESKDTPIYSLDIADIYGIDEDKFDKLRYQLNDYFEQLWNEFKTNNPNTWSNLTFILENTGRFNIDYDYSDLKNADDYERHIIWKYKYLGIHPTPDRKRDVKILEEYLNKSK